MRKIINSLMATLPLLVGVSSALAQQTPFPATVRLVVPFAPGAGTDVMARAVAAQLGARIGSTIIVDNRVGAAGQIGTTSVAKGPKDGSILLFTSSSLITTAATSRNLHYSLLTDFVPISIVADGPMLVGVSAQSNIKTPADLIAAAKAKPDRLTSSSGGVGSVGHLAAELLNDAGKVQMRHIPYKGAAPALVDLAAGTVDMLIASYSTLAPQIKSGRVVPIAVTYQQPSAAYPGLPPMATAAPGYNVGIWYGVFAPAGLPADMVQRLNREINEIAKTPELRQLSQADGAVPVLAGPEELSRRIRDDFALWKRLAAQKNIVIE
ncbi:MAG TPA: tripartite tricarboxylate transporter substrate-binding protein [Ramlibacter sp.]|nr:tripartite tricarboxylate transporter substrate-binding protein [Ramlibacter sp.]